MKPAILKNYLLDPHAQGGTQSFLVERENMPALAGWYRLAPSAKKIVGVLHGITAHGNRHADQIKFYHDLGYSVFWFDFRGHGQSGGPRTDIQRFEEFVEDVRDVIHFIRANIDPNTPIILSGHSLGGIALTHYLGNPDYDAMKQNIAGFIADTPTYGPSPQISQLKVTMFTKVGKVLSKLGLGTVRLQGFKPEDLARNPQITKGHFEDKLCARKVSLRTAYLVVMGMEQSREFVKNIAVPSLYLAGTADQIAGYNWTVEYVQSIPKENKAPVILKLFEGAGHELFFDVGYSSNSQEDRSGYDPKRALNEYYQTIKDWLERLS